MRLGADKGSRRADWVDQHLKLPGRETQVEFRDDPRRRKVVLRAIGQVSVKMAFPTAIAARAVDPTKLCIGGGRQPSENLTR